MSKKEKKQEPKVYNRTVWSLEQIKTQPLLKTVKNNWRQRDIVIYQHPELADSVISIGTFWDGSSIVVSEETKEQWRRELNNPNDTVTVE